MAVRMVSAIARTIPTVAGFSAMCPLLVPGCRIFIGVNRERCVSYFTLRWLSKKCNFESARQRASAQSMRASVQVTAPGAITSMIAAMSTRPNRQNRGTCSRMSEPLVQKQKLRLVNRINARRGHRPRHDRYDGQRHPVILMETIKDLYISGANTQTASMKIRNAP